MAANGHPTVAAILVAAGEGQRLGASVPKAFCVVAGRTLLDYAYLRFREHDAVRDLIVVAPASHVDAARTIAPTAVVVEGGQTRRESVWRGLAKLGADVDLVLVHDVARPFVPAGVISRVVDALAAGADAVIPVLPVSDTIKRVRGSAVIATVDRSTLRAVQTPQGFRRSVLAAAHASSASTANGADGAPDDAALVEALGVAVSVVAGADESFKITRPWDLLVAEMVVRH
ncbi:MAG: 2-C-methyl-D-erythritol 4-phosphate cytidylyltransferase [Actinomycetota bacterium]|nr:2-C-methyl-D-erythritol 4-phosphate cytidylyltransferase [Actinomycetota bacterium]